MSSKWSIIFQKAQSHISMCLVQNWSINSEEIHVHVAVGLVSATLSLDFRLN